jgi:branched-chain amino acid aminotransferase
MLIINNKEASLSQQEYSNFHGTSVFTTMRSHKQEVLYFERHWQRLSSHASYFNFCMPQKNILNKILKHELKTKICDQKIRIIIAANYWSLSIEDAEVINSNIYDGVEVYISQFQPHPQLANLKTSNSLPYILAQQEAHNRGVFEALMLDHKGYLCDGSRTSIMLYDGHSLASLQGGLDGCMRQEVCTYAQKRGVLLKQIYIKPKEIRGQLLLSNSLIGVVPVGAPQTQFVRDVVNIFRMDNFCAN